MSWDEPDGDAARDGSPGDAAETNGPVAAYAEGALRVVVQSPQRDVAVVRVCGEVDLSTAPAFEAAVSQVLVAKPRALVIDLRAVTFLASRGLAALVEAQQQATRAGSRMRVVVGNSRAVKRPIVATGLGGTFEIHTDLGSALEG